MGKAPSIDVGSGVAREMQQPGEQGTEFSPSEGKSYTSVLDVFRLPEWKEVEKNGIKYLKDKSGTIRWTSRAMRLEHRTIPGMFLQEAPQVAWYDLSNPADLERYNGMLKCTVPEEAPFVEIISTNTQTVNGSFPTIVMYRRVWYRPVEDK